jgi:methionyl-tRNA formyltransferase
VRTVVCGYSEVGHACLDELLAINADVRLVVTHRDAPGEKIWFRSVAERARAARIPVITPDDVNAPDVIATVAETRPELLFSFYFRQMMRRELLDLASEGALNLHGSLLPRYRGRAPVNWVLVNGERETGVTLHYMDEKPDHGDIVAQRAVAIEADDDALDLTRKLAAAGRVLIRETYPLLVAGRAPRIRQRHGESTYFGGRSARDGAIDWRWPAERVRNLVRAVTDPWPGAFTNFRDVKLIVWKARNVAEADRSGAGGYPGQIRLDGSGAPLVCTGDGWLELVEVSWGAEAPQRGREWAVRAGVATDDRLADGRGT